MQASYWLPREGAIVGAKTAFKLALGYLAGFCLILSIEAAISTNFSIREFLSGLSLLSITDLISGFFSLLFIFLFYGSVLGILPATILGAITGWLTGKLIVWRNGQHRNAASQPGLITFLILALPINAVPLYSLMTNDSDPLGQLFFYGFLIGLPSLIYLFAGWYVGGQLYDRYATTLAAHRA